MNNSITQLQTIATHNTEFNSSLLTFLHTAVHNWGFSCFPVEHIQEGIVDYGENIPEGKLIIQGVGGTPIDIYKGLIQLIEDGDIDNVSVYDSNGVDSVCIVLNDARN